MAPAPTPGESRDGWTTGGVARSRIAQDARVALGMGGNLLRCFWSVESVIAGPVEDLALALNSVLRGNLQHSAVFLHSLDYRVAQLDRVNLALAELQLALDGHSESRFRLDFDVLDTLFDGLDDANRASSEPVGMLLVLVSAPPRWIIEAPSDATLQYMGRGYTFASLWQRYVNLHAELYRRLVSRFALQRPRTTLRALEIFNEPDYNWTPEEMKIEGVREDLVNPVGKYVTELHLSQVPVSDQGHESFEVCPWGFQMSDAAWAERNRPPVGVLAFDWGPKFDWYVMCAAQLQTRTSRAIKEEAQRCGVEMVTVSGSVTHNNVDYLVRLHRADPAAFENIDRIGLHPYHWVNNDAWDDHFVRSETLAGWWHADPRSYAASYFKRFDFLAALEGNSGDQRVDAELRAILGERKLWLTEFGIGTKILQGVNALDPEINRLIRPRGVVGATAGFSDVVWEDLWQAFIDQVEATWLREHNVECLLLYGPSELDRAGFDLDDDDRTNLALFAGDGTPRLEPGLISRISSLMQSITGLPLDGPLPPTATPVSPELYRRPWRAATLSEHATDVATMLSLEERQLLFWLASSYYRGEGAIVDGGCFVGGSTVPLAEGLKSTGAKGMIDVYDRFETEPYMNDHYFVDEPRTVGESFLSVFQHNTRHVSDRLRVHADDLLAQPWFGGPIEILFVDLSKTWQLNDFIVEHFFPHLIPGRSVVVQQDFVFAGCPWVPLTMEYLSDWFEPIGFAEYCSVVYVTRAAIPADLEPVSAIAHPRRMELIDQAIRRFRGYPRDVLECAKATLLLEVGDVEQADAVLARVADKRSDHYSVTAALQHVATFR